MSIPEVLRELLSTPGPSGHEEPAAAIEPYLADAHRAIGDRTLVAAGMAAQPTAVERFDQLRRRFACAIGEQVLQLHVESVRQYGSVRLPWAP